MKSEIVEMTPDLASKYLAKNTRNRHIQESQVAVYAAAMKDGRWSLGGSSPVKVGNDGTLLNGQHSLTAVVQSGVTVEMAVWSDIEPEAQAVMDTGLKRTFPQMLQLTKEADPNNKAAATNMLYYWDQGLRGNALTSLGGSYYKRAQIPQLLEYFENNREEVQAAVDAASRVRRQVRTSTRLLALSYAVFARIDAGEADFFFDRLETGESLEKTDPIFLLRKRLLEETNKLSQGRARTFVLMGLIFKAWNLYRDGENTQLLTFRPGGTSKEAFPEPH